VLAIIRRHRMHEMHTVATDDPVVWCVSQYVCLSYACALQKLLNGLRPCWGWRLLRLPGTFYWMWLLIPLQRGRGRKHCPYIYIYIYVGTRLFRLSPDGTATFNATITKLVWPLVQTALENDSVTETASHVSNHWVKFSKLC